MVSLRSPKLDFSSTFCFFPLLRHRGFLHETPRPPRRLVSAQLATPPARMFTGTRCCCGRVDGSRGAVTVPVADLGSVVVVLLLRRMETESPLPREGSVQVWKVKKRLWRRSQFKSVPPLDKQALDFLLLLFRVSGVSAFSLSRGVFRKCVAHSLAQLI